MNTDYSNLQGFISLHRKAVGNPIWTNPNLAHLFVTLLLLANHKDNIFSWNGKEQLIKRGQLLTGRNELSSISGINVNSIKDYLVWLVNLNIITIKSTNRFSIITIVKYGDYQKNLILTPALSPTEHQHSTNRTPQTIMNNNDNKTITNVIGKNPDKRKPEIQELYEYGKQLGLSNTKQNLNRYAINRLLKGHTVEQLKKAVEFSQKIRDEAYAPQVNNWMDLEDKYLKLRDWVKRQQSKESRTLTL